MDRRYNCLRLETDKCALDEDDQYNIVEISKKPLSSGRERNGRFQEE